MTTFIVITTIQPPTSSVKRMVDAMQAGTGNTKCIIIGDKAGPRSYQLNNTDFFDLDRQLDLSFDLGSLLPTGHYSRKNIGYLIAISKGAANIYETDDDNSPLQSWQLREKYVEAREIDQAGWVNIYRAYSDELIWPRGFPLDEIMDSEKSHITSTLYSRSIDAPVQQGLAEGAPDVDAVWRLSVDREISFHGEESYFLPAGPWCPFNSQSTWWWPEAYPLLYLPSYCSFRMTDIWRGFIAQRCLWAMGYGLVFHPAEVYQERNEHNLMKDFQDEIPGYLRNNELVQLLTDLKLRNDKESVGANLLLCYDKLIQEGFFEKKEFALVQAWLNDLDVSMAIPKESEHVSRG